MVCEQASGAAKELCLHLGRRDAAHQPAELLLETPANSQAEERATLHFAAATPADRHAWRLRPRPASRAGLRRRRSFRGLGWHEQAREEPAHMR